MAEATPEAHAPGIGALIQDLERLRARYIVSASKSQSRASQSASLADAASPSPLSGHAVAALEGPAQASAAKAAAAQSHSSANNATSRSARIRHMLRGIAAKQSMPGKLHPRAASIKNPGISRASSLRAIRGMPAMKVSRSKQGSPGSKGSTTGSPRLIPTAPHTLTLTVSPTSRSRHGSASHTLSVQAEDSMLVPLLPLPGAADSAFSPLRRFSLASADVAGSPGSAAHTSSASHTTSSGEPVAQQVVADMSFGGNQVLVTGPPMRQRIDVYPDGTVATIHSPVALTPPHHSLLNSVHDPPPPPLPAGSLLRSLPPAITGSQPESDMTCDPLSLAHSVHHSPTAARSSTHPHSNHTSIDNAPVSDEGPQQQDLQVVTHGINTHIETGLKQAQGSHAAQVVALRTKHAEELQTATAEHKAVLRQLDQEHQVALAGVEQRLSARISALQSDKAQGEQRLQELQQQHEQQVEQLRAQLEAVTAQQASTTARDADQAQHGSQVSVLGDGDDDMPLAVSNELLDQQQQVQELQAHVSSLQALLDALQQEKAGLQDQVSRMHAVEVVEAVSHEEYVSSLEQRLEAQSCAAAVLAEAHQALQQEVQELRADQERQMETVSVEAQAQARHLSSQIDELCQAWSAERQELDSRSSAAQQQAQHLGGELAATQQALQEQQGVVESLAAELGKAHAKVKEVQQETKQQVAEVTQLVAQEQDKAAGLRVELDQARQAAAAQQADLAQQVQHLAEQLQEQVAARQAAQDLCEQLQELCRDQAVEKQLVIAQLGDAAGQCAQLERQVAEAVERSTQLEEQLAAAQAEVDASDAHFRGAVHELQSVHSASFEDLKSAQAGLIDLQQQLDVSHASVASLEAQLGKVLGEHEQMVGLAEEGKQQCVLLQQQLDMLTAAVATAAATSNVQGAYTISQGGVDQGLQSSNGGASCADSDASSSVEAAQLQLQGVTTRLEEYASRQSELEAHVHQLEAQLLGKEETCREVRAALAAAQCHEQQVAQQAEVIESLQQQFRRLSAAEEASVVVLTQQVEALRGELAQVHMVQAQYEAHATGELAELASSCTTSLAELSQELAHIREQLAERAQEVSCERMQHTKALEVRLSRVQTAVDEAGEVANQALSCQQLLEQRITAAEQQRAVAQEQAAAAEQRAVEAEQQLAVAQEQAGAAEAQLAEAVGRAVAAEEQVAAAQGHHSAALEQAATAYGQISQSQGMLLAAQQRVVELEAQLQAVAQQDHTHAATNDDQFQEQVAQNAALQADIDRLMNRTAELELQVAELQSQLQAGGVADAQQLSQEVQVQVCTESSATQTESDGEHLELYPTGDPLDASHEPPSLVPGHTPASQGPDTAAAAAEAQVQQLTAQVASLQQQLEHQVELCSRVVLEKADLQMRWRAGDVLPDPGSDGTPRAGVHDAQGLAVSGGSAGLEAALRGQIAGLEAHVQQLKDQVHGLQQQQQAWMQAAGRVQDHTLPPHVTRGSTVNTNLGRGVRAGSTNTTATASHSSVTTVSSSTSPVVPPHSLRSAHEVSDVRAHVTLPGSSSNPAPEHHPATGKQPYTDSHSATSTVLLDSLHPLKHVPPHDTLHVMDSATQGHVQQPSVFVLRTKVDTQSSHGSTRTGQHASSRAMHQQPAQQGLASRGGSRPAAEKMAAGRRVSGSHGTNVRLRSDGRVVAMAAVAATSGVQGTTRGADEGLRGSVAATWGLNQLDQALQEEISSLLDDIASQCAQVQKVEALLDALERYAAGPTPLAQPPPPAVAQVLSQQGLGMLQQLQASVVAAQAEVVRVQDMLVEQQLSKQQSGVGRAGTAGAGQLKPGVGTRVGYGARFQRHRVVAPGGSTSSGAEWQQKAMQAEFTGRIDTFNGQLQRAQARLGSVMQLVSGIICQVPSRGMMYSPRASSPEVHIHVHSPSGSPAGKEGVAWQAYLALCRPDKDTLQVNIGTDCAPPSALTGGLAVGREHQTVKVGPAGGTAASLALKEPQGTVVQPVQAQGPTAPTSGAYQQLLEDAFSKAKASPGANGVRPPFSLRSSVPVGTWGESKGDGSPSPGAHRPVKQALEQLKALRRSGLAQSKIALSAEPVQPSYNTALLGEFTDAAMVQQEDIRMRAFAKMTNDVLGGRNSSYGWH